MNNIDNIITHIKSDASKNIDMIRENAESEARKIKDEWSEKLKLEVDAIKKRETQELKNISERSITSSEIKKQKIKLSVKNDAISDTINKVKDKIVNLPINDYVLLLKKLYEMNVPTKDAVIRFSKNDLDRLPKDFFDSLVSSAKGCKVEIAKEPANIVGGFIIDFGDIIWNMSVESIIDKNLDTITDKANKILFGV